MSMEFLTDWYKSNCDGRWEQEEGITIVTIDSPGWQITISLEGTPLADESFTEINHEGEDEDDWFSARTSSPSETKELGGRCFIAACGPDNFNDVLAVFKAFAEGGDIDAVA